MNKELADLDMRMLRLHNELRAQREIVEVLRREIIKQAKRIAALEAAAQTAPDAEVREEAATG